MGRKLELLRRGDSRETLNVTSSPPTPPPPQPSSGETVRRRSPWRIGRSASDSVSPPPCRSAPVSDTENTRRRALSDVTEHSPSPLKSFFIRMGSTGMLNTSKHHVPLSSRPKEQAIPYANEDLPGGKVLFKSCSTSQLSTSYVRGEDPADGLDLSLQCSESTSDIPAAVKSSEEVVGVLKKRVPSVEADPSYVPTKTRSCDNIASLGSNSGSSSALPSTGGNRRSHFPYAFLRSKLSVLPEENGGSVVQQNRRRVSNKESFPDHRRSLTEKSPERAYRVRANSEECVPAALLAEDTSSFIEGTNTLGRRRKDSVEIKCLRRYNYSFPQSFTATPYQSSIGEEEQLVQKTGQPSYYVSSNESGYDSDGPRQGEESVCKIGTSDKCLNTASDQDGDSGIIANESSDSGSIHDSEIGNNENGTGSSGKCHGEVLVSEPPPVPPQLSTQYLEGQQTFVLRRDNWARSSSIAALHTSCSSKDARTAEILANLAPWEKGRSEQRKDETTHARRHQFLTSQLVEETSISPTENSGPGTIHRNSSGVVELGGISANCSRHSQPQNGDPAVINSSRRLPGASSLTSLHDRHTRDLYKTRFMLVRISKTRKDDILGIHLVQKIQPTDTSKNSSAVRFYISKLELDSLAARYDLTVLFSYLIHCF